MVVRMPRRVCSPQSLPSQSKGDQGHGLEGHQYLAPRPPFLPVDTPDKDVARNIELTVELVAAIT
jgi:hypothetical protein